MMDANAAKGHGRKGNKTSKSTEKTSHVGKAAELSSKHSNNEYDIHQANMKRKGRGDSVKTSSFIAGRIGTAGSREDEILAHGQPRRHMDRMVSMDSAEYSGATNPLSQTVGEGNTVRDPYGNEIGAARDAYFGHSDGMAEHKTAIISGGHQGTAASFQIEESLRDELANEDVLLEQ